MSLSSQRRDLLVRIDAETKIFDGKMQKSSAELRGLHAEVRKLEQRQAKQHAAMDKVGKASLAAGAAMAAGVGLAVRAAVQWESAFAGVAKTTDLTGLSAKQSVAAMAELEKGLRNLARTLPATHTEIAAVAEAAGQLGIKRDAVVGFTKVMIDLGETTNLTADQAATALAQIANVMGTAPEDIDRMGASLVALGNNGASTEADIVEMAQRIAGAGKQVGLSEADVFSMANTLASLGINAEAGGSAISKFMSDVSVAVETGSGDVKAFADVAGVSVEQFSSMFRDDAAKAVGAFTDGLGRIQESGGSAIVVLEEMEIKEVRMRDALLRMAGAQGLMNASVDLGREAWEANNALVEEAEKRYATTEAKMQVAKNAVNDLAIDLGSTLLPAVAGVAGGIADFAEWLGRLPGPAKDAFTIVGTLGAAIGVVGGSALIAVPKMAAFRASVDALAASSPRAATALGMLGTAMKGLGIAAGIVAVAVALDQLQESLNDIEISDNAWAVGLRSIATEGKATGEVAALLGADLSKLGNTIDNANNNKFSLFDGEGLKTVERDREIIAGIDDALAALVTSGNIDEAKAAFEGMQEAAVAQGRSVEEVRAGLPKYGDALLGVEDQTEQAAGAAQVLADALGGVDTTVNNAYTSLGAYAESLGMTEEGTKNLIDQVGEWADALGNFVQPLGAYTDLLEQKKTADREAAEARAEATESEKDSWEDYSRAVSVSVGEYLAELERQVEAQEQHADNMLRLSGRVSQGTLDELARMGPEGAPLVAELVNASDEELAKLDDLFGRRTQEATGAMAAQLYLANTLLPQLASKVGQDTATALAVALANGTTTVGQIARDYAWALQGGLAPLLQSLGAAKVQSLVRQENAQARRAPVKANAAGDIRNGHQPEIARGGEWRVWAEDETQGEAYIPLANDWRRPRAVSIWQETGRRLGVYALGGFRAPQDVPRPPGTRPFGHPISTAADRTMDLGYGEAVEFVRANAAPPLSAGVGFAAMMAALRVRFPGLALLSGLRPGAITATGNPSYHGMGRATDLPPRMDVFDWIAQHYGTRSRELIFSPAGGRQLRNGARHLYGEPTRSDHFDHVHWAMAKGGILNPHVRDRGGPLLPGFTYNGTRRPEMVLPFASGGFHQDRPVPAGRSLAQWATTGPLANNPAGMRALLSDWDRWLKQLDEAARRLELLRDYETARAERMMAGAQERDEALGKEIRALEALQDFDQSAAVDSEREAIERLIDTMEAETEAREKDYERRREINDNLFELGRLSTRDHLINLDMRMAREERYSDEWTALYKQRQQVIEDVEEAQRDALSALNRLLDEQAEVQQRIAVSSARYAEQQTALAGQMAAAEAELYTARSAAARDFAVEQDRILGGRRDALASWARLDELSPTAWGNSLGQLLDNARSQMQQFTEWTAALADARRRGVSEAVITSLGLDEGPEALGQLRQFGQATQAEIDALNVAVGARAAVGAKQARAEQVGGYGQVARDLADAHAQYTQELASAQAEYRDAVARTQVELEELQVEFLAEQAELAAEFAGIGREQGRSYGAAVGLGVRSQIPAVRAAVVELQALLGQQAAMQQQLASGAPPLTGSLIGGSTGWSNWGGLRDTTWKLFDTGGTLDPGPNLVWNGLGRTETLVRPELVAQTTADRQINVTVLLGTKEIRDIVGVEVNGVLVQHRAAVNVAGARG